MLEVPAEAPPSSLPRPSARARGRLRPEYAFLVLGIAFGLLFMVLTPPFQVPDEPAHFLRAYQVANGGFVAAKKDGVTGGRVPVALTGLVTRFGKIAFRPEAKTSLGEILAARGAAVDHADSSFADFLGSALYSPVNYAPQALGILLGRLLGLGALELLYLARLSALAFWLVAVFVAVRTTPIGKWAFVAVSLLPMTVFLAPSLSADSFVYAMVVLVVAFALNYATAEGPLSTRQVLTVVALSVVVSLLKAPYCLLFLVFLLIPASKVAGRRHRAMLASGLLACGLAVVAWNSLARGLWVPRDGVVASPALQAASIVHDPSHVLKALGGTYVDGGIYYLVVGKLGWLDTPLPGLVHLLGIVVVCCAFLMIERRLTTLGRGRKAVQAALVALVFLTINATFYLAWSAVGSDTLDGIQGRYLIPLLVAAIPLVAMTKRFRLTTMRREGLYLAAAQLVMLTVTANTLFARYFGG